MHSRWVNLAVVVLWLVTMTWLVKEKVLPPLLLGEPPNNQTVLAARIQQPLVGWKVSWNDEPIGWALSRTQHRSDASTRIRSCVHFDRLPLSELTPSWLRTMVGPLTNVSAKLKADARGELLLDSKGQLSRIESRMQFEPLEEGIVMTGRVKGTSLRLLIQSRDLLNYRTTLTINPKAIHSQMLSPQTHLPGLHEGQTWTIEACNPLRYPNIPMEILQAEVVGQRKILWHKRMVLVWLVEYYDNPGARLSGKEKPRGRLWVRPSGNVLAQEILVLGSWMKFMLMDQKEADQLGEKHLSVDVGQ